MSETYALQLMQLTQLMHQCRTAQMVSLQNSLRAQHACLHVDMANSQDATH